MISELLLNERLNRGSHRSAEVCALTKRSLALCGLDAELMTVLRMIHLYLAAAGDVKSFRRRLMCLNLTHNVSISR